MINHSHCFYPLIYKISSLKILLSIHSIPLSHESKKGYLIGNLKINEDIGVYSKSIRRVITLLLHQKILPSYLLKKDWLSFIKLLKTKYFESHKSFFKYSRDTCFKISIYLLPSWQPMKSIIWPYHYSNCELFLFLY